MTNQTKQTWKGTFMEVIIELGTSNDIDEMELLYNCINEYLESGINYPGWIKGVYPNREVAVKGIEEDHLYVARCNGKIVGSIILNHRPEKAYNTVKWAFETDYSDVFVIHTLTVHPDYLKSGVGETLMNFAIQSGKDKNMKSIRLDVYAGNTPAIMLYEKCGFNYIDTVDLGYSSFGLNLFRLYEKLLVSNSI
jgi:ribosomal protein S18 acetylase RimI-like enzyme